MKLGRAALQRTSNEQRFRSPPNLDELSSSVTFLIFQFLGIKKPPRERRYAISDK